MFNFEYNENGYINYYINTTMLCLNALCGSYPWLVVVKINKKMQN